ncbi:erythromycin esterase family protein [Amycolatopsis thermoflava]|uniref:Erythromycin esterase-like protein n=1 Tax=Amycolatopsis thermoflava TaxID=84480 RepID=A0A3N2H0E4_9PSEU|nr:erythromycin esterase family protein [Amycolatopsis thermoflava]ROS42351.1 erythromycin esterase-like protein [Amycolatopsis thermoflava]
MTPREDAIGLRRVEDLDPLIDRVGDARLVLLGEASHGTADFYRWRAEITKRLIVERGFSFVAVEGDWPDCHRVHCCVAGGRGDPEAVLSGFDRWPRWMWANDDVVEFARWLTAYNAARFGDRPVGFHGLDVYSLWDSLREILGYLREHQPGQVETALSAMRCFEPFAEDPHDYAYSTRLVPENCESDVLRLLASLRETGDVPGLDDGFVARQNAEVVAGAERYYRTMVRGDVESWNVRDEHMTDTLYRLLEAYGPSAKAVVWAHNTHVGDARATDMAAAGMLNVGQLVRERHPGESFTVGFGTHRGTVMAGSRWGAPPEDMPVPPAREDTVESLLHSAVPDTDSLFLLDEAGEWASQVRGHRAIGVVYDPRSEWRGNYVPTMLSRRYDAFLFCDFSSAVVPLHAPVGVS